MKKYSTIGTYSEGLCPVERDRLCGFIDTQGNEVIPCIYKQVSDFVNGIAEVVTHTGEDFRIDFNNRIIEREYCESDDIEIFVNDNKYGIMNTSTNKIISPAIYDMIVPYFDGSGLWEVNNSDSYGFIDSESGDEIIPCIYKFVGEFSEGLCDVVLEVSENKYLFGFFDTTGKKHIDYIYDDVNVGFSEGLCAVKRGNLWGFIDKYNKVIIDFAYDDTDIFSEGSCSVKLKNEWFHINKKGERI